MIYKSKTKTSMKKLFFVTISLVMSLKLFADMPGNGGYPDQIFHIIGIKNIPKDWSIYVSEKNDSDMKLLIHKDTEIEFPGNYGAPNALIIWGYNNKTGVQTSKHYFYNDSYSKDESVVVNLLSIKKDSLILKEKIINFILSGLNWGEENNTPKKSKPKKDKIITDTPIITKEKDTNINPTNNYKPIEKNEIDHVTINSKDSNLELILIVLALLSFAFIIWIYIQKRRKE